MNGTKILRSYIASLPSQQGEENRQRFWMSKSIAIDEPIRAIHAERHFNTRAGGRAIYSQILIEEGHCEGSF